MLTNVQLKAIIPSLPLTQIAALVPGMISAMMWADISTARRIGGFISQCAHESQGLTKFKENLNYSAEGLQNTFGKYFNAQQARDYHRQPERIGNRVYANRMGNGDEASGDGFKYRGRGAIHCTGKDKYVILSKLFGVDFVANPDLLAAPEYAFLSAAWYWQDRKINVFADACDIRKMTIAVNGGLNGLEDRKAYYARARQALGF